jgi:hypothetical protein
MPQPTTQAPARPRLRALWMERFAQLAESFEQMVPTISSEAALDASADRMRADIRSGRRPWPPRIVFSGSAPSRLPAVFTWHHPFGFRALPEMQWALRELVSIALARPAAPPVEELVRQMDLLLAKHYMHAMWRHHGRRTFYLDPGTAALLLETPLPEWGDEWTAARLHLPHQAFAIALPEARYFLEYPGDQRPQPVDTVVVAVDALDEDWPGPRELSLLVASRGARTTATLDDDNTLFAGVALDASPLGALRLRDLGRHAGIGDDLLRLAIGTCLYLNSEHPRLEPVPLAPVPKLGGVTNKTKRRRREQRAERECRLPLVWVGRGEWDLAAPLPAADQTGRSWRLTMRHVVRGHYKRQAYGPGREERKVIWVKPYERGADFADALRAHAGLVQPARGRARDSSMTS